jgi:hypothetical protein
MMRNAQNIGVTRGTVSSTAFWIISGVAWRTSTVYFFSSRPKPRSALCCSKGAWPRRRCGFAQASSATTAGCRFHALAVLGLDLVDAGNLLW